jgi:hypothetical protein
LAANAANAVALSIGVSPLNPAIKGGRSQNSDSISASDGGKKEEKTPPSFFPLFFFTILSRAIVPFCRSEKGGL